MLTPRKKISKQEIKEDKLVTYAVKAQKFYQANAKVIQYGMLAVLAVVVISTLMVRSKRQAEAQAAARLGIAEYLVNSGMWEQATPELNGVIETFSGTRAAGKAVFYLAKEALDSKKYEEAEAGFKRYIGKYHSDAFMTAAAMAGVAACMEDSQRFQEGYTWYEKAYKKAPKSFEAPFYLKDAARCATLAGQKETARRMYQKIVDEFEQSSVSQEAEFFLAALQ